MFTLQSGQHSIDSMGFAGAKKQIFAKTCIFKVIFTAAQRLVLGYCRSLPCRHVLLLVYFLTASLRLGLIYWLVCHYFSLGRLFSNFVNYFRTKK